MDVPAIRADELTKYYGQVIGVEELSFDVERGEVYGFLGANGAGKTTTMRLLLDLLRPSKGRASVLGVDCHRDSRKARAFIGYLPGELPTYPDLTAAGYLDYLARLDGRPCSKAWLRELLERFDVSGVDLARRLRDHSHGMKQKIGIIQALMSSAPVLILDEPTSGLDPFMAQAFRDTLDALKRGGNTTVFLSSHVLAEVEDTCVRIGLVRGGRMVASETIATLRKKSARVVTIEFDAPVDSQPPNLPHILLRARSERQWVLEISGALGPLLQVLSALPVRDLQIEPFRLEDYIATFYGIDVRSSRTTGAGSTP
jgi:ABC-2 type transport system ATP-binding protein